MNVIAVSKDFRDNSVKLQFQGMGSQGVWGATYMQSISKYI
jgi:hypothetical protein